MNFSPTYISSIVALAMFITGLFNIKLNESGLTEILTAIIGIISAIVVLIRRYQKGDISIIGKSI